MSRLAQQNGATALGSRGSSALADDSLPSAADDICPVCKSSRYLNPKMLFLVNPDCYHKMCSSCVDRIFSHGPAQCPVAKCHKTLRKHRFRKQTFEDMKVEREVDIRRRVAEVFNRREDEFETLRDWNDYLEEVENVTYGLIEGIDVEANERKLDRYRRDHASSIKTNANLAQDEIASMHAQELAQKEQAKLRRAAARREEEEERKEVEEGRRRTIDELATRRGNAESIAREGENRLKASLLRRAEAGRRHQQEQEQLNAAGNSDTFVIRGLKKRTDPLPEETYDPFGGVQFAPRYHVAQDRYEWDWLDKARNEVAYAAGGYDVQAYCQRALCDAFMGLGVFVGDEMAAKEAAAPPPSAAAVGPVLAASEPKKAKKIHSVEDDDVF